ncbi:hypothetical protein SeLEV6574_g07308 [Synchytrium endobioticum]|uniref:Uncharacterized protein n=1 Tax=Synchytrium endobioticum TaxID=286115 RepID=A0A507CLU3_9FUNG|nr:hypothetical protein SeLEV6574_g07308 [Synchytrium endobioticum]
MSDVQLPARQSTSCNPSNQAMRVMASKLLKASLHIRESELLAHNTQYLDGRKVAPLKKLLVPLHLHKAMQADARQFDLLTNSGLKKRDDSSSDDDDQADDTEFDESLDESNE